MSNKTPHNNAMFLLVAPRIDISNPFWADLKKWFEIIPQLQAMD